MESTPYLVLRLPKAKATPELDLLKATVRSAGGAGTSADPIDFRIETPVLDAQSHRELSRDPEVAVLARAMPLRRIAPVPSAAGDVTPAPLDGATWGVHATGALQSPYVGHGVTVAVLDTGIDAAHEAFKGVTLVQKDFTGEGDGDADGHGTHVAGTIFGQPGAGIRYSVAPGVRRALIGKVIGEKHSASTKELIDALQWAADGQAHIVNLSLGFDFPGLVAYWVARKLPVELATSRALAQYRDNLRFFDAAMTLLRARAAEYNSLLVVAASGNESQRDVRPDHAIESSPPAAADGIVSVGALHAPVSPGGTFGVAPFSNIGVALAAPGVGIHSAQAGGGYVAMNGTSMASPHVAGIAALWAERQLKRSGRINPAMLAAHLTSHASRDRLGQASYADVGEGLVTAPRD